MSNKETAAAAVGKFLMDLSHAKNAEQVTAAVAALVQKLTKPISGQVAKKGKHCQ